MTPPEQYPAESKPQAAVKSDAPLMIDWSDYEKTDDYANTKKWAAQPEHTEGSLWAAYAKGYKDALFRSLSSNINGELCEENAALLSKLAGCEGDGELVERVAMALAAAHYDREPRFQQQWQDSGLFAAESWPIYRKDAEAALSALPANLKPASAWRPIKDCPMDGTKIMVTDDENGIALIWYDGKEWVNSKNYPLSRATHWQYYDGGCLSDLRIGSTEAEVQGHAGLNPVPPSPLQSPSGWRPISEAPKDGTWVLLAGGTSEDKNECPPMVTGFYDKECDDGAWAYAYVESGWRGAYYNPTHWCPLPSPPEQGA